MSILSSVTSILALIKIPGIGVPREEGKPTKPDGGNDKHSKWNDDHKGRGDYSQDGDKDDYSKLTGKDDYSKHVKGDYSEHDDGWKNANNDGQPRMEYCQPQNEFCDPKPSDDCGKGDAYRNPGEALAKVDFSHRDFSAHGSDHSGDMQAALASMSSDDALEYAISQLGPAEHLEGGHFDVAADTSHDTDA
jgi:hypothetical protein